MLTARGSLALLLLAGAIVFVVEAGCNWQSGSTCTLPNPTGDDTLGRRTSGLLAIPQNQGRCGSCWAFAAAHTYTDIRSIRAGQRTDLLSSQYLVNYITSPLSNRSILDLIILHKLRP